MSLTEEIFAILSTGDDVAGVEQFMTLLRHVPGLRQWYRSVTLDPMARQKLDAYLDGKMTPTINVSSGRPLLRWIAGAKDNARHDIEKLKQANFAPLTYGGLSRGQVIALIRKYQAGTIDCASFLVLHALRRDLASSGAVGLSTANAAMRLLKGAVSGEEPKLIHQLARAAEFFDGQKIGAIKSSHFGYSAWWKLNLLGYMLHHPKPTYRTGELLRHLAGLKLQVDPSDIRRFCRQHKIARDSRRGRPKKNPKI